MRVLHSAILVTSVLLAVTTIASASIDYPALASQLNTQRAAQLPTYDRVLRDAVRGLDRIQLDGYVHLRTDSVGRAVLRESQVAWRFPSQAWIQTSDASQRIEFRGGTGKLDHELWTSFSYARVGDASRYEVWPLAAFGSVRDFGVDATVMRSYWTSGQMSATRTSSDELQIDPASLNLSIPPAGIRPDAFTQQLRGGWFVSPYGEQFSFVDKSLSTDMVSFELDETEQNGLRIATERVLVRGKANRTRRVAYDGAGQVWWVELSYNAGTPATLLVVERVRDGIPLQFSLYHMVAQAAKPRVARQYTVYVEESTIRLGKDVDPEIVSFPEQDGDLQFASNWVPPARPIEQTTSALPRLITSLWFFLLAMIACGVAIGVWVLIDRHSTRRRLGAGNRAKTTPR